MNWFEFSREYLLHGCKIIDTYIEEFNPSKFYTLADADNDIFQFKTKLLTLELHRYILSYLKIHLPEYPLSQAIQDLQPQTKLIEKYLLERTTNLVQF